MNEDGTVNQDALVNSYLELEQMRSAAEPAVPVELAVPAAAPAAPADPLPEGVPEEFNMDEFFGQFATEWTTGEAGLSAESYAKIAETTKIPQAYVERFMANETILAQQNAAEIQDSVGGKESYDRIMDWASTSLNPRSLKAFQENMRANLGSGNIAAVIGLMEGVKAQYDHAIGASEYDFLTATDVNTVGAGVVPFTSAREMRAAQAEPDYQSGDPAAHKAFDARLAISAVDFA